MEVHEFGVLKKSEMFFSIPPQIAKRLLYYPIAAGHFYCNNFYCVERKHYDSILALYIVNGNIILHCNEQEKIIAKKGELLLINCYEYHKYCSDNYSETLWFHFDGADSLKWFEEIVKSKGQKINCSFDMENLFLNLINDMISITAETIISQKIYRILCEIIAPNNIKALGAINSYQIENAKIFIKNNISSNITIDDIAKQVNMSSSYFHEIFKKITGFTPYDYLQQSRLTKAKELLQLTNYSVQEIAYKTGFNSDSNFIYFFKKETGLPPLKFKKLRF